MENPTSAHPMYCVIFHSPGTTWKEGVAFPEQPGVINHIQYMDQLFQQDLMVMGGPFPDNTGGMVVLQSVDIEKIKTIANADPSIKAGLLKVEVKLWMVPMTTIKN